MLINQRQVHHSEEDDAPHQSESDSDTYFFFYFEKGQYSNKYRNNENENPSPVPNVFQNYHNSFLSDSSRTLAPFHHSLSQIPETGIDEVVTRLLLIVAHVFTPLVSKDRITDKGER